MKRYHLADVLTLCEVISGVILLGMVFLQTPLEYALWVFIFGQLCDAFDGPCHRRWPYPNDGKPRWWRTHVVQIEHGSDIFLSVVYALFLMCQPVIWVRCCAFVLGCWTGSFCFVTEDLLRRVEDGPGAALRRKRLIIRRRWIYLTGIAGGIAMSIWGTPWTTMLKVYLTATGICLGIMLFLYKIDRAFNP